MTENIVFDAAQPECVTIIPTHRCNASCKECCFESNPHIRHRMTREQLLTSIHNVKDSFPDTRYVVLTGGEVTLLKQDLIDAIALLTELGLGSRIVTNGHWGRTDESAERWVSQLVDAGLNELNLSTGDEHQEWVPFSSVARAAWHALQKGIITVVVVEGQDDAGFTIDKARENEHMRLIEANEENRRRFILMKNIWMPFHEEAKYTADREEMARYEGCDNIFKNFVINPYGQLVSCCGLTMEYIPELKVGNAYNDSLRDVYREQFDDLLKLWIWLDGTRYIFDKIADQHGLTVLSPHPCAICAQLYKAKDVGPTLERLLRENEEDILFRAAIKTRVSRTIKMDMYSQPIKEEII
jgi:MoaA/NifB/PqqE/SkfB family radical SAM enzyme